MIAALFGLGLLVSGGDDESRDRGRAGATVQLVERVARRIERVRGLRFKRLPVVRTLTPEEAREEGLAALDRDYPRERRRADERVLTLLGLLPPRSDLRELAGRIFGEEVAGYYDDRTRTMTLVEQAGGGGGREIVLAHELTHALEDQHFDLDPAAGALDDARTAHTALVEGTATVAMADYVARYVAGRAVDRELFLRQLELTDLLESSSGLPPYLQRSLVFPYSAGARFVHSIGTWGPANRALRGRSPETTEQVLHPRKYRAREPALPVTSGPSPGPRWRRDASGTVGEFDTHELVRTADSAVRAQAAAAGWGGGRYVLWRRAAPARAHPESFSGRAALVLRWRWDSLRDAAEFAAALPRYVERTLDGRSAAGGVWRAPGRGFVALDAGETVTLAIAPTAALARRLAR